MSKNLTLATLNKNFEEFKKMVFERWAKEDGAKGENLVAPQLSEYTEVGTEIEIGEGFDKIRLLDTNYNGTGKKIWQFVDVLKANEVNLGLPNNDNKGGYPSAKRVHEALNKIYDELPLWLKEQIVPVDIPCYIPTEEKLITEKIDSLFLLSATEMCQNRSFLAKEGRPLEFYIKNCPEFSGWQWLRSVYLFNSYGWGCVSYNGYVSSDTNFYCGVAPAFCTD